MMLMMMSLFSRSSVCLRMHLRTPKITKTSWGSVPPDPPRVNNCKAVMFSTSANEIAPPDGRSYVRPCRVVISVCVYAHSTLEVSWACSPRKILKVRPYESTFEAIRKHHNHTQNLWPLKSNSDSSLCMVTGVMGHYWLVWNC